MPYSRVIKIGDGSTKQFAVNFALGYISQNDVRCRVGNEVDGSGNPAYRTITFLSSNLIQVSGAAPGAGVRVVFERTVKKDELNVDFENGDVLDEANLDEAQKQALMAIHEVFDGRFQEFTDNVNMGGYRVTNAADPINAQDYVTKNYVDRITDSVTSSANSIRTVADNIDNVNTVAEISDAVSSIAQVASIVEGTASALKYYENLFVGDGTNTDWTLSVAPRSPETLFVWVGGSIQDTSNYSLSDNVLTIFPAVDAGVKIRCLYSVLVTANEAINAANSASASAASAAASAAVLGNFLPTYDPRNKKADVFLASNHDLILPEFPGASVKTAAILRSRFNLLNTGAVVGGTLDQSAYVTACAAAFGCVVFPRGDTVLGNIVLSVPIYFEPGARIFVLAGATVTIRGPINCGRRQHIFAGPGNVSLNYSNPMGEDTKYAHVSWWGVFPNGGSSADLGPGIQKALNSYGNTREGCLEFDGGNYTLGTALTVPRALWIKGSGIRRTTFQLLSGTFTPFTTLERACKFSDFQFEQEVVEARNGTLIDLQHIDCVVENVRLWNTQYGIRVREGADRASLRDIEGIMGNDPLSDSALIWVQSNGCNVDDVSLSDTTTGPRDLVRIGQGNTGPISRTVINNLRTTEKCIAVNVVADTGDINQTTISGVNSGGGASDAMEAVVKVRTTGYCSVAGMTISDLVANIRPQSLVKIEQASSGSITDVAIGSSVIFGSVGDGVVLRRTNGVMSRISVGNDVNCKARGETGIVLAGAMDQVSVPAMRTGVIADGGIATITLPDLGGTITVMPMGSDGTFPFSQGAGMASFRARSTVTITKLSGNPNFAVVASDVTGSTGSSGNVTIGVVSGLLKIENRTGVPQIFAYQFTTL